MEFDIDHALQKRDGICWIVKCENVIQKNGLCKIHLQILEMENLATDFVVQNIDFQFQPGRWNKWGKWKKTAQGYVIRRRSERSGSKVQTQMQHRHFMEEFLGRDLLPNETVHHKNGVRDDNRLSNLELWSTQQPSGQRVEDKLVWAYEIVRLYGDYCSPE